MDETPLYVSPGTLRSLWQEYRIYADHLEFDTVFGRMTIPFDTVERVEVSESEIRGLMRGDLHLENFRPALKLDWANFVEHVVLDKDTGWVRRILFTPDDPHAFQHTLEEALERYRASRRARG